MQGKERHMQDREGPDIWTGRERCQQSQVVIPHAKALSLS